MKKLLFTVVLLFAALLSANAQSVSSLSKSARLCYNWLSEEGYRPSIDNDGDVAFKAEGYNFYVISDTRDPNYVTVLLPGIETIDLDEDSDDSILQLLSALAACNEINQTKKMVKASINDNGDVNLSTETYFDDDPDVDDYMTTAIIYLTRAFKSWWEEYED